MSDSVEQHVHDDNHHAQHSDERQRSHHAAMMYLRFAGMIATSAVLMYVFTYWNTYELGHIWYSETRLYMTLTMTAMMAIVMLSFMLQMLDRRGINIAIYAGAVVLGVLGVWLARSQTTVQDVSYMKAMIPHHSIAILTSERAEISDARVRSLADDIIAAQKREISMMEVLIKDIEEHGTQQTESTDTTTLRLKPKVPAPEASAAEVPDGFRAEIVISGLTYPTSVEFDASNNLYIAEAGYSYGDDTVTPRVLRVSPDGRMTVLAEGASLSGPINDLLWHDETLYVSHRGKISTIQQDGTVRDLVAGLPSEGDHHNNQLTVGPDGKIYFGQGTATNSGVVGLDNFKMGWLKKHPDFHDVPAHDVQLADRTFKTANPFETTDEMVSTLPFHPFGKTDPRGTVAGQVKASGTILRMNPDGSELEVYAWGLRNPYGLLWSPDGTLYATENGFDVRGSRPIANDKEDIYVIREGAWYGWPDYAMGLPVTDPQFKPEDKSQPQFLLSNHPQVEKPWMNFPKHAAIAKIDFAPSGAFGEGEMFVAFFGHMTPMTGRAPDEHGGHRVVRIDPKTRKFEKFFGKKASHHSQGGGSGHRGAGAEASGGDATGEQGSGGHGSGGHATGKQASGAHGSGGHSGDESFTPGPRRLLDVRFAPDGNALYIADFGAMDIQAGAQPVPGTGVIWRVVPDNTQHQGPPADLNAP